MLELLSANEKPIKKYTLWSYLKGYCTVFQNALKSLEITGLVLSYRLLKTAKKIFKGLESFDEF